MDQNTDHEYVPEPHVHDFTTAHTCECGADPCDTVEDDTDPYGDTTPCAKGGAFHGTVAEWRSCEDCQAYDAHLREAYPEARPELDFSFQPVGNGQFTPVALTPKGQEIVAAAERRYQAGEFSTFAEALRTVNREASGEPTIEGVAPLDSPEWMTRSHPLHRFEAFLRSAGLSAAAQSTRRIEGISVAVPTDDDDLARRAALDIARFLHPGFRFGRVLHSGPLAEAFGIRGSFTEVVLELL